MKTSKILIISSLFLSMVFVPLKAAAHPPTDITMEFDAGTKALNVKIVHPVKPNQQKHFISYVKVMVNKDLAVEQHFKSQSSIESQDVSYVLADAKEGDKIIIEGKCSIFGTKTKEFVISGSMPGMMMPGKTDTTSLKK
jgi:desulfoferrodoxin (superoxide reductase-like protein)